MKIEGIDVSALQDKASQVVSDSAGWVSSSINALASEAGAGAAELEAIVATGKSKLDDKIQQARGVYNKYEEQAFAHVNAAVHYAIVERPAVGIVSGLVVSSLLLGLPQQAIKRMVFNMWGETAVLQRIEGRVVDMKEKTSQFSAQAKKLTERATMAEDEVQQGMKKLKAAKAQIEALHSSVQRSSSTGLAILSDLRFLRTGGTLTLRSDVAKQISEARALSRTLDSAVRRAETVLRS